MFSMTQEEFGSMLGVGPRIVQKWEKSNAEISDSVDKLLKLLVKDREEEAIIQPREDIDPEHKKNEISVLVNNTIFEDPGRMAMLVTFLSRNHERLIKDEIYRLYVERIIVRSKNEKKASDINSMLEDGD